MMDVALFIFQSSSGVLRVETKRDADLSLLLRYNVAVPVTYKAAHLLPSIPPLALSRFFLGSLA